MPAQWNCETCFKCFNRKGDLTRHQHLHTGYKPHVCEECGKAFSQFTGLKTHRNVHTGARPYKCTICLTAFSDPSSCARHRRETHLRSTGHKCFYPGCRTSIKRRSCFMKHLKDKHGMNVADFKVESSSLDGLYDMSSPESSASPSSVSDNSTDNSTDTSISDSSTDTSWEELDIKPQIGPTTKEKAEFVDGSVLFATSSWAAPPSSFSRVIDDTKSFTALATSFHSNNPGTLDWSSIDTTNYYDLFSTCYDQMHESLQWTEPISPSSAMWLPLTMSQSLA